MNYAANIIEAISHLELSLVVHDPAVINYLSQFEAEDTQSDMALEALKVGVIAIQSASPTLDTTIVQQKFGEVETQMRKQMGDFQLQMKEVLRGYFEANNGVVPRSIDGIFGDDGTLGRTFDNFFDPNEGRLCRLLQTQIGPESIFGKTLDPQNKQGIVSLIEARVQEQVEAKLDEVLCQFSLDDDESAMSRLKLMLSDFFGQLNQSLGIRAATNKESHRGHVKGLVFERDLYDVFGELGRQLGDETEFVGGTAGTVPRCKKGDFVVKLGETSGAPNLKICVEVKDSPIKLKDAIDELQDAKANRESHIGIFVFSRGCEPSEVGDFRKIGEDFYVTVDKEDLAEGRPLMFFDSAYRIARALIVAADRKQSNGELDVNKIEEQIDALSAWSDRIADMSTKARTIQNSGKLIEQVATDLKCDMVSRLTAIHEMLRSHGD